jgi:glutathione peroxidase
MPAGSSLKWCYRAMHMLSAALCSVVAVAVLAQPTGDAMQSDTAASGQTCAAWLNHKVGKLHRDDSHDLCELTAGKVVLIVNTASFCGYTPQFKGLEALYQRFKDRGLVLIGFPSDDFFQEYGDEAKTADVCYVNYGVTFPMTSAVKVRGSSAHPVFRHLHQLSQPSWNFNKYLVGKDGSAIAHFGSNTSPDSPKLIAAIEQAL